LRMERLPFAILPNFIGMIAILDKDRFGIPVFFLLRQKGAAFQDENAFPTRSKALRESAATGPGADNDNVETVRVHRAFLCGVSKFSEVALLLEKNPGDGVLSPTPAEKGGKPANSL